MENREQWSPFLSCTLIRAWARKSDKSTWKNILMYWSERSLGGIFEAPFEDVDEEEVAGEGCKNLQGEISGHGLPDS